MVLIMRRSGLCPGAYGPGFSAPEARAGGTCVQSVLYCRVVHTVSSGWHALPFVHTTLVQRCCTVCEDVLI